MSTPPDPTRQTPRAEETITSEVVEKAIEAAGGLPENGNSDAVKADLIEAAKQYALRQAMFDDPPSSAQRLKAIKAIETRAKKLAEALGTSGGKDPWDTRPYLAAALARQAHLYAERVGGYPEIEHMTFPSVNGDGSVDDETLAAFESACNSVWRLYEWAKSAREETEQGDYSHWEAKGPSAQAWLVGRKLPSIYQRHFNRKFGISKPSFGFGPPFGPGIRFVKICAEALGLEKSPEAIEKTWDRYRKTWDISDQD